MGDDTQASRAVCISQGDANLEIEDDGLNDTSSKMDLRETPDEVDIFAWNASGSDVEPTPMVDAEVVDVVEGEPVVVEEPVRKTKKRKRRSREDLIRSHGARQSGPERVMEIESGSSSSR